MGKLTDPLQTNGEKAPNAKLSDLHSSCQEAPGEDLRGFDFKPLFEGLSFAGFILTTDGIILDANSASKRLTGENPSDLPGKPFNRFLDSKEHDDFHRFIKNLNATGRRWGQRFHLKTGKNRMAHCRIDGEVLSRPSEDSGVLLLTAIDWSSDKVFEEMLDRRIGDFRTELHQQLLVEREKRYNIEEMLRNIEQRYIQAEQIGRLGNWEWDLKKELMIWSLQTFRIFNVEPSNFQPSLNSFMEMIHPADQPKVKRQIDMVISNGLPIDVEFRFWRSEGDERIVHMVAEIRYDNFGNPNKLVGIVQDITERTRTQNALRRREDEYIKLVENSLTGIYIIQDGRIRFCNKRFAEMYGFKRGELLGLESWKLVPPEDRERINRLRKVRLMGGDVPTQYEARGLKKNGDILWVARRHTLITYKNKPAILGNAVDITLRKSMEDKLRRSEQALRFLSTQLMAAQESERKRISRELHDTIAQNLAGIKLSLSNQLEQPSSGSINQSSRELLEDLIAAAESGIQEIRRIINNLRPPTIDDLGILPTLSWHCRQFQKSYPDFQVKLKVNVEEDDVPEPLKMVIFRLIQEAMINVAKHSSATCVSIGLRKGVGKLELRIEDNGLGFDFQEALSPSFKKTEWGIIGMKERTELSNGSFSISKGPDGGTCINSWWPL